MINESKTWYETYNSLTKDELNDILRQMRESYGSTDSMSDRMMSLYLLIRSLVITKDDDGAL